jgi:NTE family protein
MVKRANAIFEGGGVKAVGMLGALHEAERRGYDWVNLAGTSAGAIIASLAAAGYTAGEIKEMVWQLDFTLFKDKDWLDRIPFVGLALSLWFENGLYEGDYLEGWVREKLAARGISTFKDLILEKFENDPVRRYKLVVTATDVSRRKLLRLPYDLKEYNLNPDTMPVCKAVRMSASLPFFYEPCRLPYTNAEGARMLNHIIDGGVLSNFPVWIFDSEQVPDWPTFGFKVVEPEEHLSPKTSNPFNLFTAILSTILEARDRIHELDPKSKVRTISIPSLGIKTTDFEGVNQQREELFQAGVTAATGFFDGWDFDSFKINYCGQETCSTAIPDQGAPGVTGTGALSRENEWRDTRQNRAKSNVNSFPTENQAIKSKMI